MYVCMYVCMCVCMYGAFQELLLHLNALNSTSLSLSSEHIWRLGPMCVNHENGKAEQSQMTAESW